MKTKLTLLAALFALCFQSNATEHFPSWSLGSVVQDQNGWHFTVTIQITDMFDVADQTLIAPNFLYTQEYYLDGIFQGGRAYDATDTTIIFTGYIGDDLFGQTDFAAGQHIFTTYFGVPNGTAHGSGNFFLETPTGDKPVIPTVPDSGSTALLAFLGIGLLFGAHRLVRA